MLRVFAKSVNRLQKGIQLLGQSRSVWTEPTWHFSPHTGLPPVLSGEALRHLTALYREKLTLLNENLVGTDWDQYEYHQIVSELEKGTNKADVAVRDAASMAVNIQFFLAHLHDKETGGDAPEKVREACRTSKLGSFEAAKELFDEKALNLFGCGWVWMAYNIAKGEVVILSTDNADGPAYWEGMMPIMSICMWEIAHLPDYKMDRETYIQNFWKAIDWQKVSDNLDTSIAERRKYEAKKAKAEASKSKKQEKAAPEEPAPLVAPAVEAVEAKPTGDGQAAQPKD